MPTKAKPPTAAELRVTLGSAEALWSDIIRVVEELVSPLRLEWKASKAAFGRMCLIQHRKRTLLYLTPAEETITVAIVLGNRAFGLAMASSLPASMKKLLSAAKPYAEGRGIRFAVTSPSDLSTIRELVKIKATPK
jgi:hypothetical protein